MSHSAASLPARRVAIVQSESGSLHNPSLGVTGVLVYLSAQTAGLPAVAAQPAGPLTAFIVVLFGRGYPLKRRDLSPGWLANVASALAARAVTLRGALAQGLGRPTAGQK